MEYFDLLLSCMKPTTLACMYADLLEAYTNETSGPRSRIRQQLIALVGKDDAYSMFDAAIDANWIPQRPNEITP